MDLSFRVCELLLSMKEQEQLAAQYCLCQNTALLHPVIWKMHDNQHSQR